MDSKTSLSLMKKPIPVWVGVLAWFAFCSAISFAAFGKLTFKNQTGQAVSVFTKTDTGGVANFILKADESHTVNGSVKWGWRYNPATGQSNTDGNTPCSAGVKDDLLRR